MLYDGGTPLWASGTDGRPVGVCIMQGDGNWSIYDATVHPIWSSDTWQHPGSRLVVQDDGNLVIYRPDGTRSGRRTPGSRVVPLPRKTTCSPARY